jgi:hypothetical protein
VALVYGRLVDTIGNVGLHQKLPAGPDYGNVSKVPFSALQRRLNGDSTARFAEINRCLKLGAAKAPLNVALWVVTATAGIDRSRSLTGPSAIRS